LVSLVPLRLLCLRLLLLLLPLRLRLRARRLLPHDVVYTPFTNIHCQSVQYQLMNQHGPQLQFKDGVFSATCDREQ
jgi:hypothetical protein